MNTPSNIIWLTSLKQQMVQEIKGRWCIHICTYPSYNTVCCNFVFLFIIPVSPHGRRYEWWGTLLHRWHSGYSWPWPKREREKRKRLIWITEWQHNSTTVAFCLFPHRQVVWHSLQLFDTLAQCTLCEETKTPIGTEQSMTVCLNYS